MSQENSSKRGYRAERIERTVAETLEFELLPALEDPLLHDLHVLRVEVGRNLSNINVIVVRSTDSGQTLAAPDPEDEIQAALERAQGYLRSELANVLCIKRMPLLRLRYLSVPMSLLSPGSPENGGRA